MLCMCACFLLLSYLKFWYILLCKGYSMSRCLYRCEHCKDFTVLPCWAEGSEQDRSLWVAFLLHYLALLHTRKVTSIIYNIQSQIPCQWKRNIEMDIVFLVYVWCCMCKDLNPLKKFHQTLMFLILYRSTFVCTFYVLYFLWIAFERRFELRKKIWRLQFQSIVWEG